MSHLGENKVNMKKIKSELYRDVVEACYNKQHATGTVGETKMIAFPKLWFYSLKYLLNFNKQK